MLIKSQILYFFLLVSLWKFCETAGQGVPVEVTVSSGIGPLLSRSSINQLMFMGIQSLQTVFFHCTKKLNSSSQKPVSVIWIKLKVNSSCFLN